MRTPDTWTEQYLEDWVCANYEQIWGGPCVHVDLVGRQITLPRGGRLDVLLAVIDPDHTYRLVVIEIKRGSLDTAALNQLLGYIRRLQCVYRDVRVSGVLLGADSTQEVRSIARAIRGVEILHYWTQVEVTGVEDFSAHPSSHPVDRPGWFDANGMGRDDFGDLRVEVNASLRWLRTSRNRLLPVRLDDIPSRIYRTLP